MRGWEGKTGWEQAGAEQEPPTPLDPGPAHFEAPPIQGAWQDFPSSPGKGGGGLGLVRAAGGRDIDHSSLHSWRSQVAARTIFSSPGGGRGAAGRDEIELVGGEREESRSIRTQAAVPSSMRPGVLRGLCGKERPPQGVSWGCQKHRSIAVSQ